MRTTVSNLNEVSANNVTVNYLYYETEVEEQNEQPTVQDTINVDQVQLYDTNAFDVGNIDAMLAT
jgi:hypothetical protein